MRILSCGGRDYRDELTVYYAFKDLDPTTTVIHGGASGSDYLTDQICRGFGYEVYSMRADWEHYGREAGPQRNRRMLDMYGPIDILYVFPGGHGTEDMVGVAAERGIPFHRFGEPQNAR